VKLSDLIMGPLIVGFGALVVWGAFTLPRIPGLRFGPDLIPLLIGIGLIMSGASILITALFFRKAPSKSLELLAAEAAAARPSPLIDFSDWQIPSRQILAAGWTLLGPVFCIAFFDIAGFPILALVYMAGLMALMNARPLTILIVAPLTVLALHIGFSEGLRLQLPAGWLAGVLP
jgi:putative tricarboxylic transport membrane protein